MGRGHCRGRGWVEDTQEPADLLSFGIAGTMGFPGGSDSKESTCNAGDPGSVPGLGRSPGKRPHQRRFLTAQRLAQGIGLYRLRLSRQLHLAAPGPSEAQLQGHLFQEASLISSPSKYKSWACSTGAT